MPITKEMIRSRIAVRFCFFFVLCVLLPTIALFVVSFNKVSGQLDQQNYQQLKQQTRAYGLSLYDRLIRIDNTLRALIPGPLSLPAAVGGSEQRFPKSGEDLLEWVSYHATGGFSQTIHGQPRPDELAAILEQAKDIDGEKTRIIPIYLADAPAAVYFVTPVFASAAGELNARQGLLVGQAKTAYLWGVGPEPILPSKTELAVYDDTGKCLIGTVFSPGANFHSMQKKLIGSDSRVFSYSQAESQYLAALWSLFVTSNFDNKNWNIVLAKSEQALSAGLANFRNVFFLLTLLAPTLTLFLSLIFIRRNLSPVDLLKKGTERVAQKDFSVQLDIRSGDEFEELGASFNSMTQQLKKQFNTLTTIERIDRAVLASLDQQRIIDDSLALLQDFFSADAVLLGRPIGGDGRRIQVSGITGAGAVQFQQLPLCDSDKTQLFAGKSYQIFSSPAQLPDLLRLMNSESYAQFVSFPLMLEKDLHFLLILAYRQPRKHDLEECQQARQIADQLTIGLANAKLVDDLERLILGTIEALARTVDAKSKWTAGHSERVAALAGKIGRQMGCGDKEIALLQRGGLLHDIGKIGVPMAILNKAGKLNAGEYEEIKSHPAIGQKILEPIDAYHDIIPLVAQHHERFDGTGYPSGLREDAINPLARILIVADVYDALVSDRPYRDGWIKEKARLFIEDGAGTHFDPAVVEAFIAVCPEV